MSKESIVSSAKASIEAYNSKDWDAVRNSITEDCIYDEPATHRKSEGIDAVITDWKGWATAMPDSHATFEAEHVTESGVVFELTWRGTNTGPMQGPDGEIPATGKSMEMRSCYVIEMEGDKAKVMKNYFDIGTMMAQLGLV